MSRPQIGPRDRTLSDHGYPPEVPDLLTIHTTNCSVPGTRTVALYMPCTWVYIGIMLVHTVFPDTTLCVYAHRADLQGLRIRTPRILRVPWKSHRAEPTFETSKMHFVQTEVSEQRHRAEPPILGSRGAPAALSLWMVGIDLSLPEDHQTPAGTVGPQEA